MKPGYPVIKDFSQTLWGVFGGRDKRLVENWQVRTVGARRRHQRLHSANQDGSKYHVGDGDDNDGPKAIMGRGIQRPVRGHCDVEAFGGRTPRRIGVIAWVES